MTQNYIKFGFTAGVVSPKLLARSDLDKYDLGLKTGRNWFVDYLGGASTRAGTEFCDYIEGDEKTVRLKEFRLNRNVENTYCMVITEDRFRLIQDGAYVLNADVAVSGTTATTVTATAHGYSDGDWIKLNGRTLVVTNSTTNTFEVEDVFGVAVDPSVGSPSVVASIYESSVPSELTESNLFETDIDQQGNELRLCAADMAPRVIARNSATNWSVNTVDYLGSNLDVSISAVGVVPTGSAAGVVYAVSAVDYEGRESPIAASGIYVQSGCTNITTTAGSCTVSWASVLGAAYYRVYRTLYSYQNVDASLSEPLGFIGTAKGNHFTDENITPDFTQTPIIPVYPFNNNSVATIQVTAPGSGYGVNAAVSITDPGGNGTGFAARPIIKNGRVRGVMILNPGINYDPTSTITITGGGGTGATTVLTFSGSFPKHYPACTAVIQQRRVYAGSNLYPNGIWGSRIGDFDRFHQGEFASAADPYFLLVSSPEETPIRYILEHNDGFFAFSAADIKQIRGDSDLGLNSETAKSTPQPSEGCAWIKPIRIDRDYFHLNAAGTMVNVLRPSNLPTYFLLLPIGEYSNHYFQAENQIKSWGFAPAPGKLLWAVREDGTFLSCALSESQNVQAWSDHTTKGLMRDVEVVSEGDRDSVYFVAERTVNGVTKKYIERMANREVSTPDEVWAVDSGLTTTSTYPAADLTVGAYTGSGVTVTASASVFSGGDIGKVLRVDGGRATVASYVSGTEITVDFDRDIPARIPEYTTPPLALSGTWTLDAEFSTVSGLWHLEGETVEVLGDGLPLDSATVSGGSITLSASASKVTAGLGFSAELETLPPTLPQTVVENLEKRPIGVAVRLYDSKEILVGSGDEFYDLETRGLTAYASGPSFQSGIVETSIRAQMDLEGTVKIKKVGPVQATVLGLVTELEFASS